MCEAAGREMARTEGVMDQITETVQTDNQNCEGVREQQNLLYYLTKEFPFRSLSTHSFCCLFECIQAEYVCSRVCHALYGCVHHRMFELSHAEILSDRDSVCLIRTGLFGTFAIWLPQKLLIVNHFYTTTQEKC